MSQHSTRRNVRGGVAAGAVLAAVTLTTAFAYTGTAGAATSCADALTAYNAAQNQQAIDKSKLNNANKELDDATQALAAARAADAADDSTHSDDPGKSPDDLDRAKSSAESRAFLAGEAQSSAQHAYDADVTATSAAKTAADAACQGPAGQNGSDGKDGAAGLNGKDGIDAKIILAPTVCARATVKPDTRQLVRVIALIPCPPVVPVAPATPPAVGQPVTVVNNPAPATQDMQTAPVPPVQEAHLPVTH